MRFAYMSKIKAAVMLRPGEIEVIEFPEPELEDGAVLLDTIYSEVCGTDVHLFHGKLSGVPYPIIPGHVNVGVIRKIRGEVSGIFGRVFHEGDTVTFLDVHETCNSCWHCLVAKATTRCPNRSVYGITYSSKEGLLGGWSESIYLKPGVKIMKLPEDLSPESFIGGGCGLPTGFHAVERADLRMGDLVVVQGLGPVGLSAIAFSSIRGAEKVIALGAPSERLEIASQMGADHVIDIETLGVEDRVKQVLEYTDGRGADVVIEATGNPSALVEGLKMVRDAGFYVVVGQYTDNGPIEINPHYDINRKHLDIRGCWGVDFSHFYRSIRLMSKHSQRLRWENLISRRYPLDEAERALNDVEELKVVKAVIEPGLGSSQ
jgi:L-iditol 2-dehydrogenase